MGRGRAPCCDKSKVKRGPWSPAEDLRLVTFIQKHGHGNWRALPLQAGLLRCGKSCRLRWINYLRPDVKRGNFTPEEEQTIIRLHKSLGNKWSKIASHCPGRTDNEIKNVWNTHLKKRSSSSPSILAVNSNGGAAHRNEGGGGEEEMKKHQESSSELLTLIHSPSSSSISSSSSTVTTTGDSNDNNNHHHNSCSFFIIPPPPSSPLEEEIPSDDHDQTWRHRDESSTEEQREASSTSTSSFTDPHNNNNNPILDKEIMGSSPIVFNQELDLEGVSISPLSSDLEPHLIELPLESEDMAIWDMLDNLDSFQFDDQQLQKEKEEEEEEKEEEASPQEEEEEEDGNGGGSSCKNWLAYLEKELGLVSSSSSSNNEEHEQQQQQQQQQWMASETQNGVCDMEMMMKPDNYNNCSMQNDEYVSDINPMVMWPSTSSFGP